MNENLDKNGWVLASHNFPHGAMDELVKRKNEFLKVSFEEVEKAFNISFSGFENEKIESIELVKGIFRAFLRYDPHSLLLAQSIWKELKKKPPLAAQIKYLALPYPIIHLPQDTSEIASRHKDAYDYIDHFYTTWTPLNDCFHGPLRITEKTYKKNSFLLSRLRSRLKFLDKLILSTKKSVKPDIPLGKFLIWHGRTDHEGLLNQSDEAKVAVVVRFTSSPIMSEATQTVQEIEKYIPSKADIFTRELVQNMIEIFKEMECQRK